MVLQWKLFGGSSIDLNSGFSAALSVLENTNKNVFITGRAGTGKSTLLQCFRDGTRKNIAVLAPTGVAALNVRGQTLHSFFRFRTDVTPDSVGRLPYQGQRAKYENLDAIIIDEISMVRADLLDCVDAFMRLNGRDGSLPFGGVQMIFIGDLYQLPPVVTHAEAEMFRGHYRSQYFFDSRAFGGLRVELVELDGHYRQKDEAFIGLLDAIRANTVTDQQLESLNTRFNPAYTSDRHITLTSTNRLADAINTERLQRLRGEEHEYMASVDSFERELPADEKLRVRVGMRVMMLNNDKEGRWVNGSLGTVAAASPNTITVKLDEGGEVEVGPYKWELFKFAYDSQRRRLVSRPVGSFTQLPIMPAWAVTIHKSQGKTFDRVIIDIGSGTFAHGQLYVALSRCRTLDGIVLRQRIEKRHVLTDSRVADFLLGWRKG